MSTSRNSRENRVGSNRASPSLPSVLLTVAGRAPRSSAHFLIVLWLVVVFDWWCVCFDITFPPSRARTRQTRCLSGKNLIFASGKEVNEARSKFGRIRRVRSCHPQI